MDAIELILLLSEVPGIGEKTLAAVLRRNAVLRRTPEQMLRLPPDELAAEYVMRREVADEVAALTPATRDAATALGRDLRRRRVAVLTLLDATYPARLLEQLDNPPPVLYAYGSMDLASKPLFAVANSNGAGEEALAACDQAAAIALERGWHPVTGHNRQAYQRPALVARRGSPFCGPSLSTAFLVLQVAPGDPVQAMVGEHADSATIARLRAQLHLDIQIAQYAPQDAHDFLV